MQTTAPQQTKQIKQFAKLPGVIIQTDESVVRKCGCYIKNTDIVKQHSNKPLAIPLKHIDYQIQINNTVARVILQQVYENPTQIYLQLEYSVPIDPKVCIYAFEATFGATKIKGVVEEREKANVEYEKAIQQGKKAAIGQINKDSHDIMNLKVGNIAPKETVNLRIEYLYELDVSLNVFWRIMIQSKIWPRYLNQNYRWKNMKLVGSKQIFGIPEYTWSFKVTLTSSDKIVLATSTTHNLMPIQTNQTNTQIMLVMPQQEKPYKDFTFIYTTQNVNKPTYTLSKTDTSQTLLVSFIPRFNDLELTDAQRMERASQDYEVSVSHCRGEFVFILDRSGSMGGSRMNNAKKALMFFLKSLPTDSLFNIVSFGNNSDRMFRNSVLTSDKNVSYALQKVEKFGADMGGTEIYSPLAEVLDQRQTKSYPKHVFLLTDGSVSNTEKILELIRREKKYSTVHGIGIGNGCSTALINGCSQNSRGRSIFISDEEDPAEKIINLLDKALSPVITDFQFEYNQKAVESVIPNPRQMPYILKNDPVNMYFLLLPGYEGEFPVTVKFTDPITKKVEVQKLTPNLSQTCIFQFLDKKAQHKRLQLLLKALKNKDNTYADILFVKPAQLKEYIVKQSIKHQVLCEQTAFICIETDIGDQTASKVRNSKSVTITVPQFIQQRVATKETALLKKKKMPTTSVPAQSPQQQAERILPQVQNLSKPQDFFNAKRIPTAKTTNYQVQKAFKQKQKDLDHKKGLLSNLFGIKQAKRQNSNFIKQQKKERRIKKDVKKCEQKMDRGQQQQCLDEFEFELQNQMLENDCVSKTAKLESIINEISKVQTKTVSAQKVNKQDTSKLVNFQNADGSWSQQNSLRILELLEIDELLFKELTQKNKHIDFVLTVLVAKYLQINKDSKFILIIKKAKEWIKVKAKQWSITKEDQIAIESLLVV